MPKVFIKKVWGYHPASWPVLGFGKTAGANKLNREYNTGDWVALVGTKNDPTPKNEQGRLLGLIKVTNIILDDIEGLLNDLNTDLDHHCFNKNGAFKWPVGFPYLEAYRFENHPLTSDVLPDHNPNNGRAEAAYGMLLDQDSAQRILSLPKTEEIFPISKLIEKDLKLKELLTGRSGPVPAIGARESEYSDGENFVYIFHIKGKQFYKVGRSNDIHRRLDEFNSSPHARFTNLPLELFQAQPLPDANTAHKVEQSIHAKLDKYAVGNECFSKAPEKIMMTILAK